MLFVHVRQQLTNKMEEEHPQAITGHGNQIKTLEFTNQRHQQKILRLNEEIGDPIKTST